MTIPIFIYASNGENPIADMFWKRWVNDSDLVPRRKCGTKSLDTFCTKKVKKINTMAKE